MAERVIGSQLQIRAAVQNGLYAVHMVRTTLAAATRLSAERGPTNGSLGSDQPLPPEQAKSLAASRKATDDALAAAVAAARAAGTGGGFDSGVVEESLHAAMDRLARTRRQVDILVARPRSERGAAEVGAVVDAMIAVIPELIPALNRIEAVLVAADPALSDFVTVARLATDLRDYAGQLGSVFTPVLVTGRTLSPKEIAKLERVSGNIEALDRYTRLAYTKTGGDPAIQEAIDVIQKRFMGDGRALVAQLVAAGMTDGSYGMTAAEFAKLYVPQIVSIEGLRDVVVQRIFDQMERLHNDNEQALVFTITTAVMALFGIIVVFGVIVIRMLRPLASVSGSLRQMAAGDANVFIPDSKRIDEIGDLIGALRTLQLVVRERERDNWLRTQVSIIMERLQQSSSYSDFANTLTSTLYNNIKIMYGAVFIADNDKKILSRVGGYALDHPERSQHYAFGDGLVGQAALDQRLIELASSEHSIPTGCGSVMARRFIIIPVVRLGVVTAVIELAPLQPLTDDQRALLDALLPAIAANLQILSGTIRTRKLLADSCLQATG